MPQALLLSETGVTNQRLLKNTSPIAAATVEQETKRKYLANCEEEKYANKVAAAWRLATTD